MINIELQLLREKNVVPTTNVTRFFRQGKCYYLHTFEQKSYESTSSLELFILKFRKWVVLKFQKILKYVHIDNDVYFKRAVFQFEILCTMSYIKMINMTRFEDSLFTHPDL